MVMGGYGQLADAMAAVLNDIRYNEPVAEVTYTAERATVTTQSGTTLSADAVVVSVPIGVLQKGSITFSPPLPQWKSEAYTRIGMGKLNKVCKPAVCARVIVSFSCSTCMRGGCSRISNQMPSLCLGKCVSGGRGCRCFSSLKRPSGRRSWVRAHSSSGLCWQRMPTAADSAPTSGTSSRSRAQTFCAGCSRAAAPSRWRISKTACWPPVRSRCSKLCSLECQSQYAAA